MSIVLSGVARSFGDHELFSNINLTIDSGERVALIGRNGSGKSTLLRLIAGFDRPDTGTVSVSGRIAMLSQQSPAGTGRVADSIMPAELATAAEQIASALALLTDPTDANLSTYAAAEEAYRQLGGYDFDTRAAAVLDGLGLDPDQDSARLSGGQQRRVLFAQLLLSPADILLLDEPTNHLDVRSREWLEQWLLESPALILFVSHDRVFLDNIAQRVLELERGHLNDWYGNYSEAMALKAMGGAAQLRAYQAQERRKRSLEAEMHRLRSSARSADHFNRKRASGQPLILATAKAENVSRTLAGRSKALEQRIGNMDSIERPYEDTLKVSIPLPEVPVGPEEVISAAGFQVSRGGRALFGPLDLHLRRGDRIAVSGPNGSGKTSLLLSLTGHLPHQGQVTHGHGLSIFEAWQHGEELDGFGTAGEAVYAAQPALKDQDIYHLFGQLGLPADLDFAVRDLSGGQRTRLALARLAVTRAHLLVLDEPTNNLDLEAIAALEKLLLDYPGTLLFSSHDRRLVERVTSGLWELGK